MKLFKKHFYILGEKPQTDWRRVLITATILALVVSVYGFFFYHQISIIIQDVDQPVVSTVATSTVKSQENGGKMDLGQTMEFYVQKKENFEKMLSELKKS